MDFSTLEEAWGIKTFETPYPVIPQHRREHWEPEPEDTPVAGPWGYRPSRPPPPNPVAMLYMQEGVQGILRALPQQAVHDLRAAVSGGSLHTLAACLLLGFVVLIVYDVLFRHRLVT